MRQILSCRNRVAAFAAGLAVMNVLPSLAVAAPGSGFSRRAANAHRGSPRPVFAHSARLTPGYGVFGRSAFARHRGGDRFGRNQLFGPISPGYAYDGYGEVAGGRRLPGEPVELSPSNGMPIVIGIAPTPMVRPQVIVINSTNRAGEPRASLHGPGGPGAVRDRAAFMAPRVIRVDVPPG